MHLNVIPSARNEVEALFGSSASKTDRHLMGLTTAYVANVDSGTVTPITTATNTPGKPINVGRIPVRLQ